MVGLRAGTASLHGPPTTSGPNLHFSLNCAAEWIEECRGTATITATQRLTAHGHTVTGVSASARRRHVLLGRLKFATGGNGKTYTFKVALNTTGRHLLAKFKRLPATLTITAAARELRVPPKTVTVAAVRVMFRTRAALRRKR
jgi:hypothetical protein